jgi:hypothetical protein
MQFDHHDHKLFCLFNAYCALNECVDADFCCKHFTSYNIQYEIHLSDNYNINH